MRGVCPPKVLALSRQRQRSPNHAQRGQGTLMNEMDTRWRPGESADPDRDIAAQL